MIVRLLLVANCCERLMWPWRNVKSSIIATKTHENIEDGSIHSKILSSCILYWFLYTADLYKRHGGYDRFIWGMKQKESKESSRTIERWIERDRVSVTTWDCQTTLTTTSTTIVVQNGFTSI